jgi:hypothetical protein
VTSLPLKGKPFLDSGYVYAPYIPLQVTPVMGMPAFEDSKLRKQIRKAGLKSIVEFSPMKGIRTRYAKKLINQSYFGHVTIGELAGEKK